MEIYPPEVTEAYRTWAAKINEQSRKVTSMLTAEKIEEIILTNSGNQTPQQPKELTPDQIEQNEFNAGLVEVMHPYYNNIIVGIGCAPLQADVTAYFKEWIKTHDVPKTTDGKSIRDIRISFKFGKCVMTPVA